MLQTTTTLVLPSPTTPHPAVGIAQGHPARHRTLRANLGAAPPSAAPAATASEGATGTAPAASTPAPPSDPLQGLTPADLRDLASLEEAYRAGRMDQEQYQRERARILNRGR